MVIQHCKGAMQEVRCLQDLSTGVLPVLVSILQLVFEKTPSKLTASLQLACTKVAKTPTPIQGIASWHPPDLLLYHQANSSNLPGKVLALGRFVCQPPASALVTTSLTAHDHAVRDASVKVMIMFDCLHLTALELQLSASVQLAAGGLCTSLRLATFNNPQPTECKHLPWVCR